MNMDPSPSNHSEYARSQQSLLRSFSVIHRSPVSARVAHMLPDSRGIDNKYNIMNDIEAPQGSQLKRDRNGRAVRNQSSHRLHRRRTSADAQPSPSGIDVTPNLIFADFPAPPFDASHVAPPQARLNSLNEPQTMKLQRRHSPHTIDVAKEMAKISREMQYERRSCTAFVGAEEGGVLSSEGHATSTPCLPSSVKQSHMGFRADYALGENSRSPSHMIVEPSSKQAHQAICSLKKHDFAFIKRSDGSFSNAILAHRGERCMIFVLSYDGKTKTVHKKNWSTHIRLVSMEGLDSHPSPYPNMNCSSSLEERLRERPVSLCQDDAPPAALRQEIENDDLALPLLMIAFRPQMDEECSLISSVSDRACSLARDAACGNCH